MNRRTGMAVSHCDAESDVWRRVPPAVFNAYGLA
jgi:hypothetical protein